MSSTKRNRASSDANTSTKKFKSAKDVASEDIISVDVPERKSSDDNDPYWELSAKRRITIQEYKSTTLVSIREFYEKDGKTLPGKSGISLTPEQFAVLIKAVPAIKAALAEKGIDIREEGQVAESDEDEEGATGSEHDGKDEKSEGDD